MLACEFGQGNTFQPELAVAVREVRAAGQGGRAGGGWGHSMSGRSGSSTGGRATGAGADAAALAAAAGALPWPPQAVCGKVARWAAAGVCGM